MTASCRADGGILKFANCYLDIPSSFNEVTNTLAIEEFTRFEGTDIDIIQLSEANSKFESILKNDDFNSVESYKYKGQLVYMYNFKVKKLNFNIKNITIIADDKQLNFQGLDDSEMAAILSNCYEQELIKKLIK